MLSAVLGAHFLPLGIIATIGAINLAVPDESSSGTDLGASGSECLAEGHVVIHGMSLVDFDSGVFLNLLGSFGFGGVGDGLDANRTGGTDQNTRDSADEHTLPEGRHAVLLGFGIGLDGGLFSVEAVLCFHDVCVLCV